MPIASKFLKIDPKRHREVPAKTVAAADSEDFAKLPLTDWRHVGFVEQIEHLNR